LSKDETCVKNKSKKSKGLVHKFQGWENSTKPKMKFFQNLGKTPINQKPSYNLTKLSASYQL
jgi:hypothetical protein